MLEICPMTPPSQGMPFSKLHKMCTIKITEYPILCNSRDTMHITKVILHFYSCAMSVANHFITYCRQIFGCCATPCITTSSP